MTFVIPQGNNSRRVRKISKKQRYMVIVEAQWVGVDSERVPYNVVASSAKQAAEIVRKKLLEEEPELEPLGVLEEGRAYDISDAYVLEVFEPGVELEEE